MSIFRPAAGFVKSKLSGGGRSARTAGFVAYQLAKLCTSQVLFSAIAASSESPRSPCAVSRTAIRVGQPPCTNTSEGAGLAGGAILVLAIHEPPYLDKRWGARYRIAASHASTNAIARPVRGA